MVVRSAHELAEAVAARVPGWGYFEYQNGPRLPILGAAFDDLCPACGRALPCSVSGPGGLGGGRSAAFWTDVHRVAACLVDGPHSAHAQHFEPPTIVAAGHVIADALARHHWYGWAHLLRRATHAGPDGSRRTVWRRSGKPCKGGTASCAVRTKVVTLGGDARGWSAPPAWATGGVVRGVGSDRHRCRLDEPRSIDRAGSTRAQPSWLCRPASFAGSGWVGRRGSLRVWVWRTGSLARSHSPGFAVLRVGLVSGVLRRSRPFRVSGPAR